ncbi:MAG: hypothetical protein K9K79_04160 [Desulfohalobiaceae bacterium]|nr:hypothetical protein [Desulfohalobiaceae bacterium]
MDIPKDRFLEIQSRYYDIRASVLTHSEEGLIDLHGYSWPDNAAGGFEWLPVKLYVDSCLRVVGGEINWFLEQIIANTAWKDVHDELSEEEKIPAFFWIMHDSWVSMITKPYMLKQRFIFFVTHILHLTKKIIDPEWDETNLPPEHKIQRETLNKFPNNEFKMLPNFRCRLDSLDSEEFKTVSSNFRHRWQHRSPIHVEHGIASSICRSKKGSKTSYSLGGAKPLKMSTIIDACKQQHHSALETYQAMINLLDELLDIWKRERPYNSFR